MPTLHAASALPTAADVNIELAINRPTRNLDLVLLCDVRLVPRPAAVGAWGELHLVCLVDVLGRLAMGFGTVVLAGLASGLLRLGLGRSFVTVPLDTGKPAP